MTKRPPDKGNLNKPDTSDEGRKGGRFPLARRRKHEPTAVALEYDAEKRDSAPVVTASGRGLLAEQILEIAKAEGIPIQEDADLVEILAATEVGEEIPVDAFVAVAEILRYVYALNRSFPNRPAESDILDTTVKRHGNDKTKNAETAQSAQSTHASSSNGCDPEPDDPYAAV